MSRDRGENHLVFLQFVSGEIQRREPLEEDDGGLFRRPGQFEVRLADAVQHPPHEGERIEAGGERAHLHRLHDGNGGRSGEELSGAFHGVTFEVGFVNADFHFIAPFTLGFISRTRASVAANGSG